MSSRSSSEASDRHVCRKSSKDYGTDTQSESNSPVIQSSEINLRFPIYVESMTGTTFKLDVFPSDTIYQIKEQLENTEGIPVCQQHLIFRYKELTNHQTIEDSSLSYGSRLQLVVDLITGPVVKTFCSLNEEMEKSINEEEFCESRPLTILLFQNGDQIKVISFTSNKSNNSEQNSSDIFDSENDFREMTNNLINEMSDQKSQSRQEEDKRLELKIIEIQNQLKSLELNRKKNNLNAKQEDVYRKGSINCEKLPHLELNSTDYNTKDMKIVTNPGLHLPPIPIDSKSSVNSLNESTRIEKQNNFIKQILIESINSKSVSNKRRHSLTSNRNLREDVNRLDLFNNKLNNSINCKLRPLTAPVVNDVIDNEIRLINKSTKIRPGVKQSILVRHQNSAKTNRLKSGRRLPPIVNNSKKKVNKIRCSLCRIKLGIVNRYKCRSALI